MKIYTEENISVPLILLEHCRGVQQPAEWHPEGDVFIHSLQTMFVACKETNDIDLIMAALLHDVGKQMDKLEHVKYSVMLLEPIMSPKTIFLIDNHMRIWLYLDGSMKKHSKCSFLANHPWLPELIQLARFDKMGRQKDFTVNYSRGLIVDKLNAAVNGKFEQNRLRGGQ